MLLGPPPEKVLAGGGRGGTTHTSALSVRDHRRGGKQPPKGACARVSPRPAATAPSSRARGLQHQCAAWATGDQPPARLPAGERPQRARLPERLCPTCPGLLGGARARERKALPLGRAGLSCAAEGEPRGDHGGLTVAAPRWVPAARGAPSPAPPAKLSFWFAPPEKCGRGGGGRRAGLAAAAG